MKDESEARPVRRAPSSLLFLHPSSFTLHPSSFPPMLLFPTPTEFRKRRARPVAPASPPTPPPAALVLAAAELIVDPENNVFVRLTFDRAIDVGGLVASQVTVDDEAGAG